MHLEPCNCVFQVVLQCSNPVQVLGGCLGGIMPLGCETVILHQTMFSHILTPYSRLDIENPHLRLESLFLFVGTCSRLTFLHDSVIPYFKP